MFVQPRGLLRIVVCATQCRSSVCAAETRGSGRRHFFFALLAVFRRDRFARGVEKRSLSWGHCLYDISMCDTFRVYLYTMCVSVSVPLRVA